MAYIKNHSYSNSPYIQFTDHNGKPLTNGTLTTYIAGSTTPVTTYKDWNRTENPSTITLDENGGCVIILNEALRYKFEIRDKDGALYKTFDNVDGNGAGNKEIINQQVVVEGDYGILVEARTEDDITYYTVSANRDQIVDKQEYDPFVRQITAEVNKKINDAPADGNQYARKDKEWVIVEGGSGKTYTGIEPVIVDNENDTISIDDVELNVESPITFDKDTATIGINNVELNVESPITFDNDTATIGIDTDTMATTEYVDTKDMEIYNVMQESFRLVYNNLSWIDISTSVTKNISGGSYNVLYNPALKMVCINFQINLFNITSTNVIDILTINNDLYKPKFPNIACSGYAMLSQGSTDSLIFRSFVEDTGKMQMRFNSTNSLVNIRIHVMYSV